MFIFIAAVAGIFWMTVWSIRPFPVDSHQLASVSLFDPGWLLSHGGLAGLRQHTLMLHDVAWHRALHSPADVSGPLAAVIGHVLAFEVLYRIAELAVLLSLPDRMVRAWQAQLQLQAESIHARTLSPAFAIHTA